MTNYILLAVLFLFVSYGLLEAWPLIEGPSLSLSSPVNNAVIPDGIVNVRGTAARAAQLTLDGASILHEKNGDFSSVIALPRGCSLLTLVAVDRFGKHVTATRNIFVP